MSIKSAVADLAKSSHVSRVLTRPRLLIAANDTEAGIGRDALLRLALKHFAKYGLGAAEQAREQAQAAFFAGKREEYRHWLAICRMLDQRMAAATQAKAGY